MAGLPFIDGLEAYWARLVERGGAASPDPIADRLLLDTLRLGNQEVLDHLLHQRPGFDAFRRWIVATAGLPDPHLLDRYHAHRAGRAPDPGAMVAIDAIAAAPPVLSADDLAQWDADGVVIVRSAISREQAAQAAAFVWDAAGASPDDPDSWVSERAAGIMVATYRHPSLDAARHSARIHRAFAQLWGRADLWMAIDLVGFNPPESAVAFRGAPLHWDVSLIRPIPFAVQALLYLTDTAADQGAFRAVPGFHHNIDEWLDTHGGADPRGVDLSAQARAYPGAAGDLVIWRQDLPHGASPNRAASPRLVQYLTMYPPDLASQAIWL